MEAVLEMDSQLLFSLPVGMYLIHFCRAVVLAGSAVLLDVHGVERFRIIHLQVRYLVVVMRHAAVVDVCHFVKR